MKFFYSAAAIVSASKTLRPLDCIALRYFKAPTLRLSVIGDSEAVVLRTDPYCIPHHPIPVSHCPDKITPLLKVSKVHFFVA